ncbi:MAG: UvrD-helicase domain-containing protein [Planctomycetota bacterium]
MAGGLFVVGDPKQSIYRFRRADIVTYNEVKKIIAANGEVVVLTANFRSQKPVIDWVNETFDQVFPATADAYSPERSPMAAVRGINKPDLLGGVEVLKIPAAYGKNDQAVAYEAEAIARTVHAAVLGSGGTASAKPGDFLIISTRKRHLSIYARKLTERGVPCEVTGGAVLNEVHELGLLSLCVGAVTQPDDPVALVAALRGELFGLSDEILYAFKRAGGRFSFHAPLPETLEPGVAQPLEESFSRLRRYDLWLKRLPPVSAIERIAADLGLSACAAVGPGGNVRAGSVARAVELIRGVMLSEMLAV